MIGNPLQTVLIRKSDLRLYKFSSRFKNLERLFHSNASLYMDPLDRDMLIARHTQTSLSATQSPKWLNLSWDAFKSVENHNKSHIFATMKENRGRRGFIRDFRVPGEENSPGERVDIDMIRDRLK